MGNCANNVFVPDEEIKIEQQPTARPTKKKIFDDKTGNESKFDFHVDLNSITNPPKYDTQQSYNGTYENNWAGKTSSSLNLDPFVYYNPLGIEYGNNNTVKGSITLSSGDSYIGEWNDEGKQNGKGTLLSRDGSKYEGFWLKGRKHGYGRSYMSNGDVYEGEWIEDGIKGKGIYYKINGEILNGIWEDENLNGKG